MASFTAYTTGGTSEGALSPSSAEWEHRQAEDGFGRITVNGTVAAAALAETIVIRVNDGSADRFAFVSFTDSRRQLEGASEVELSGPGVRHLLHAGQVLQEDTTDCALPADTRWFGWMSGDYDDSAWTAPASHGEWRDQPFDTPRPEAFPVRHAQYLWRTTSYALGEEEVLFRQGFTVSTEGDYVLIIAADDEYECWLDGTKLPIGSYGQDQLYRWRDYDEFPVKLCAGAHTFAVKGRNLPANVEGQNPGWVIWAFAEAAADGHPAAQNDIHEIHTDATGGTWTLRVLTSDTTSTLDYNATSADIETAVEAQIGAGNVTVSGAGTSADPWTLEFIGEYANRYVTMQVDGSSLTGGTITKTMTQPGLGAKTVAYSTTASVVHYHPSTSEPGMTPGHILKVAMDEVRARGTTVLDDVTDGYSATLDSNGDPWTFELNLPVNLPADVHRVAVLLEEQGIDVWMDPDLTLQAAGEQGQDDTATTTITPGTGGVTNTRAVQEESTVRNIVRLRTTKGWIDVSDATSVAARGRWESGLLLDGFDTQEQAEPHTNLLLNDLATPQRPTTFEIPSEAAAVPYADFDLGDRVNGPVFGTSGFATDAVRVVGISGRIEESSIVWTVETVD